ncbi:hypothetical protein E2C00_00080 [Streptomyces sp. WAC05374]|uniref:hypothetical protein n=1 Tax=Streptomyces sp. WAC05374 TaxID=2487420 RepID=UPI000F86AF5C|nr:hypothetical protein [Streptomyces sp. WAC05374]RST19667.1 hypothetical protein EF905_00870 [Streptomyces sp. WAC05374]TDF57722.1 hypothetical protein E2C02_07845 [Streptomyces sp. WAC05374]TDF60250.1 hypothetical protein E2C00_00080 [Streptomyces sp. WAC05374]
MPPAEATNTTPPIDHRAPLAIVCADQALQTREVYGAEIPAAVPGPPGLLVLPGPSVRLSLTAIDHFTDACLLAAGRPSGEYNRLGRVQGRISRADS